LVPRLSVLEPLKNPKKSQQLYFNSNLKVKWCLRILICVFFHKFQKKITKIKIFNLNDDLMPNYDYDDLDDLKTSSFEDTWPVVGSISTPNASFSFENITILRILDLETEAAWEPLKIQLTLIKRHG
jgi:hypothetical protein